MDENLENRNGEININADDSIGGTEHLNEPMEDNRFQALEAELRDSKDKYMRLAAEFDNFRKRTAKERLELFQTAGRDIIVELLDVLDDIDRSAPQIEKLKDKPTKQGILMIFNKLRNILQSRGLKIMESVGKEFDPDLHDAITQIPAPTDDLKGKVVDEISKGYYLNDKIIRHAKVVVGK